MSKYIKVIKVKEVKLFMRERESYMYCYYNKIDVNMGLVFYVWVLVDSVGLDFFL